MIAFGPPEPDSPVYDEYCATAERIRKLQQDLAEHRAEVLREMEEGMGKVESEINGSVGAFLAAILIPAALWALAYLWIFGD